ncbi:MAG: S-layer homology domain-containing protein [Candidatus Gracilibacteria bacterium]|jgi:hypothetical protein|nr:S-layer homology domain-containing protein [Candidatus Gracilibacteria bacterium]
MKKIFSFPLGLLAFALMFSSMGNVAFSSNFSDTVGSQFYSSIDWMSENGVVNGYGDGTFKPTVCVNRVEFLKMLFKMKGVDETAYTAELFTDTPADSWYASYVKTARARGVVNGYSDGSFKPGKCVTRAEASKMAFLMYYSDEEISSEVEYNYWTWLSDLKEEDWYFSYGVFALDRNFWPVYSDSSLGANSGMSREEVAELLYRLKSVEDNGQIRYSWDRPLDLGEKYFYEKCNYTKNPDTSDLKISDLLSKDSDMVFSLNYSDSASRKNFEAMLEKFPEISESGLWSSMFGYNKRPENNLGNLMEGVFDEDYQALLGFKLGNGGFEDFENSEIIVAGKVSAEDDFYNAITKSMGVEPMNNMYCEVSGNELYFTSEDEDFYFVRYGDIFFVTNSLKNREDAMDRLKAKNGYDMSADGEKSLIYALVSGSVFSEIMDLAYGMDPSFDSLSGLYDSMGAIEMYISALTSNKLQMDSSMELTDDEMLSMYRDNPVSLLNKLPGKNLMAYMESMDLSLLFEPYLDSLAMMGGTYSSFSLEDVYEETDLSESEFELITNSPYAFSLSEVGQVYPGMVFALKLDNSDLSAGDKLVNYLDLKVDELIDEIDSEVLTLDASTYIVKSNVEGSSLRRVKLDMSTLPETFWANEGLLDEKQILQDSVFDLYYGIKKDSDMNVLLVALYPDFNMAYGQDVVKDNAKFKEAKESLGTVYGSGVSYLDIAKVFDYVDTLLVLSGDSDSIGEEYAEVKEVVSRFEYLISSAKVSGDSVLGRAILKLK